MSELLNILNFDELNIVEETTLGATVAAGVSTIALENADNITSTSYLRVGDGEKGEIRLGNGLTGLNFSTATAFTFRHVKGEKILRLRGNQVKIYRAANVDDTPPANADFASIVTKSIEGDQRYTQHLDSTGGEDYWYKFTYYNEATGEETALADVIAMRGGQYGQIVQVQDVINEAGLKDNRHIDVTQVFVRRDQATDEVKSVLKGAGYTIPLTDSQGDEYTPPMIENITLLLAAGYVMMRSYSASDDTDNYKSGKSKVTLAQAMLKKIQDGTTTVIDRYGEQMAKTSSISGWPDDSTKDATEENAGGERMFSVKKVF